MAIRRHSQNAEMANDAVVEAAYCRICRRSSDAKWAKHVFTSSHQQRAPAFLQQRIATLDALLSALSSCSSVSTTLLAQLTWKCSFCEIRECVYACVRVYVIARALADRYDALFVCCTSARGWVAGVEHHGSDAHRKQLDAFCRRHRCDVDRAARRKLHLPPATRLQLRKAFEALQRQEDAQQQPLDSASSASAAAGVRAEAFLSSAAARLQQVHTKRAILAAWQPPSGESTASAMAPQAPLGTRIKAVESSLGILQHPLGEHDGKRVWGGGIVKIRKPEWVAWPIDALVKEEDTRSAASNDAAAAYSRILTHRVTERAFGDGLGQIARVSWGDSVANVHTAAVPPWMVQSEEEYKRCNQLSSTSVPQRTEATNEQRDDTKSHESSKGLVADESLAPNVADPTWLPNFGGVWQEGPRSKTKREFLSTQSASAPTQFQPSSVYQRRRRVAPASSGSVSPSPPTQSSAPRLSTVEQPQETKSAPSGGSADPIAQLSPAGAYQRKRRIASYPFPPVSASLAPAHPPQQPLEAPPETPMDAKKQLLLAQKQRLRAKMAAKKGDNNV